MYHFHIIIELYLIWIWTFFDSQWRKLIDNQANGCSFGVKKMPLLNKQRGSWRFEIHVAWTRQTPPPISEKNWHWGILFHFSTSQCVVRNKLFANYNLTPVGVWKVRSALPVTNVCFYTFEFWKFRVDVFKNNHKPFDSQGLNRASLCVIRDCK